MGWTTIDLVPEISNRTFLGGYVVNGLIYIAAVMMRLAGPVVGSSARRSADRAVLWVESILWIDDDTVVDDCDDIILAVTGDVCYLELARLNGDLGLGF